MAVYPDNDSIDFSDDTSDDGFFYAPRARKFRISSYARLLIGLVRNEWQNNAQFTTHHSGLRRWFQMGVSLITAPRFRRYAFFYLILLLSCAVGWVWFLSPLLVEHTSLLRSLDTQSEDSAEGRFGTNAMPEIENMIQIKELNANLLPQPNENSGTNRRLIFIGDVHGCKDALDQLLEKASFNSSTDHLVFTGDLINRGPDSTGVVDLARNYSASCVRGNNEDHVLLLRHAMAEPNTLDDVSSENPEDDKTNPLSKTSIARRLARQLNDEQAQWLDACPVILKVGQITGMGEVVVVHGGLIPGLEIEQQDPVTVINLRTIDLETHVPSSSSDGGTKWIKLFNKHQSLLYSRIKGTVADPTSKMTTVIYGHDATAGLTIEQYTKGIDSNCLHGDKLTAFIVGDGGKQSYVHVKCRNYMN